MSQFKQIKPQKARGKFREELWSDPAYHAELKHDGDRRIAQFCSPWVRFTGTRESVDGSGFVEKTANLPQLHIAGVPCKLEGTVLDGEIIAPHAAKLPGGESKYVTAIMGSLPERAIELQKKHGWLEYMVFDCLWSYGDDIREAELHERQRQAYEIVKRWGCKYAKFVSPHHKESEKRRLWEHSKEGIVFKHQDHYYGDERLWVKLKKEATADVVVMGFEPGKGKYRGSVGAIVFGQYVGTNRVIFPCAKQMGTCRGFTDEMMNQFFLHPKKYVGRVIEILHNGREPTGAFRHPRFKRFRDDKNAKDCVYNPEET